MGESLAWRAWPGLAGLLARAPGPQVFVFLALAVVEVVTARFYFGIPQLVPYWSNPTYAANQIALLLLAAGGAFVVLAWSRRAVLVQAWPSRRPGSAFGAALLVNLLCFGALVAVRAKLASLGSDVGAEPGIWGWLYFASVMATGASLLLVLAPMTFWTHAVVNARVELLLALVVAVLVLVAGELSRESWSTLSFATLKLSYWILSAFESNAFMDADSRILGVGDFRVQIWAACSGYEGITLILAFLAVFFWVFRAHLRFPNAFCLVPIGIAVVWLFNSVRIAALVSLGAHVSPEMAIGGFHTWSGWIAFLIVSVGIMAGARHSSFVWAAPRASRPPVSADAVEREVAALLAPFIASMAATIVAAAFAPHDQWLYLLKVFAIGGVVWGYRALYEGRLRLFAGSAFSFWPIGSGLAVGLAWVLTAPQEASPLGAWLAGLPVAVAVGWLAFRAIGSVLLVPIAEELAFRGYLYRVIATLRIATMTPTQLRILALVVSSILFGLLHDRWLAAALSGVVYGALVWRSGRISDPIVAHLASNGLIVIWSVAFSQWNLL